jgi:hypothetical protein
MANGLAERITRLEAAKRDFGRGAAERVERLVHSFAKAKFKDPESLIRAHDTLLFLRAFPHSKRVAQSAEMLLARLANQVRAAPSVSPGPAASSSLSSERWTAIARN